MISFNLGSIRKNLTLLVMFSVLPALAILLYTGIEQRRHAIENAKHDLSILTHGMAEVQKNITKSTRQILSTLSLLPAIQGLELKASSEIFRAVLEQNPDYQNITLTDPNGDVLASGLPYKGKNLADRKHVREALDKKDFAVGEYILTRVGKKAPALAFAYPVLDKKGSPIAVLTTAFKLDRFSHFHDALDLPAKSFVAVTDHQGIRLFFYPPKKKTNPVGKPIRANSWEIASKAQEPGMFLSEGSDGVRRIFAFEQVRLTPEVSPYIYVWAGVPEAHILKHANAVLARNLLLMFFATVMSLLISWAISKNTLIFPINNLVTMVRKFAEGNLEASSEKVDKHDEFSTLTQAFHDMADNLIISQRALQENEAQLRTVIETIPDLVWLKNPDGVYLACNPKFELFFGAKQDEIVGKTDYDFVDKELADFFREKDKAAIAAGRPSLNEEEVTYADDGHRELLETVKTPMFDSNGELIGVLGVGRDITDRKKMEEEQVKLKKLESVGVLAGGIAHDFNNILAAILGNINLALFDVDLKDKTKKLLSEAEKASLRAKDLTQQLLTFAKGGEPVKETSSLRSVIKDSANFVLHGDKVACRYDIPDNLWLVDIDKGQISQVVQNIVLNASHAMPDGGTIHITCKNSSAPYEKDLFLPHDKKFIKITIEDSGIGIPSNLIDKIFDPYFSTKQKGSGLGLAISHSIITKHNGHISANSMPGEGTTFTIYLPASEHQEDLGKKELPVEEVKNKARIMVMDDEELVRDVAKSMLGVMGHEVILVQDGAEAIESYKQQSASGNPIDIIVMDITIPGGMGGKEAVKEILAFDPEAKVIVSSGYSNDPIMANCEKYGFCAAIGKPYQLQVLTKTINRVIELKHQ